MARNYLTVGNVFLPITVGNIFLVRGKEREIEIERARARELES